MRFSVFSMCCADTVSPRCGVLLKKRSGTPGKGVDNICKLLVFNSVVEWGRINIIPDISIFD